jgi:DNA-binding response OmpR family regulator
VIVIVSSLTRERSAFAALCETRGWACTECDSVRAVEKLLGHLRPRVILTRHKLSDGYSDDVIARLSGDGANAATKIIVLLAAEISSAMEARQVALGADCVHRDPVRTDVLAEFLSKYRRAAALPRHAFTPVLAQAFPFADARVHPVDRTFQRGKKTARLTPREVDLCQLLARSHGQVVTYETLYGEILGRKFRGDTSNLRVLLGKLVASARRAGTALRRWLEVIPKLGYRYRNPRA